MFDSDMICRDFVHETVTICADFVPRQKGNGEHDFPSNRASRRVRSGRKTVDAVAYRLWCGQWAAAVRANSAT